MFTSEVQSKAAALRSIMQNKDLYNKAREATMAPIGSTKREQLRGVLKSIGRGFTQKPIFDGRGGPGPTTSSQPGYVSAPSPVIGPNPMVPMAPVAPPQPTFFVKPMTAQQQVSGATAPGGSGILSSITNFLKNIPSSIPHAGPIQKPSQPGYVSIGQAMTRAQQATGQAISGALSGIPSTAQEHAGTQAHRESIAQTGGLLGRAIAPTPQRPQLSGPQTVSRPGLSGPQTTTPVPGSIARPGLTGPMSQSPGVSAQTRAGLLAGGPMTQAPGATTGGATSGQDVDAFYSDFADLDSAMGTYGAAAVDEWYNTRTPEEQTQYKDVYDAVKSGMGAETFAFTVLADREKMRNLFPGVPEDQLPIGASLSRQLGDLQNRLRDEFKIDYQLNGLLNKVNTGLTLENDLTSYIRGKDQYLGQIDSMLDKTKEQMAYSDMSNPYMQKQMTNYADYLTILKGRQNQRYMDFLDQSIGLYNSQAQQAQNLFTQSLNEVERRFTTQGAILEEDFNWAKTILTDMYGMVSNQESLSDGRWKMEQERIDAALGNQKSIYEIEKLRQETEGSTGRVLTTLEQGTVDNQILGVVRDKDTGKATSLSNKDIFTVRELAAQSGLPQDAVDTYYMNAVANTVESAVASSGNFNTERESYYSTINQLLNNNQIEDAQMLSSQLIHSTAAGLNQYVSGKEESVQDVMKSLVGKVLHGKVSGDAKDKEKFVEKYKDNLSEDLLREMYDLKEINKAESSAEEYSEFINAVTKKEPGQAARELINNLVGRWETSFF